MRNIMAAIREIMASIRFVMMPVFKAGKWTVEAVRVVTAPVVHAVGAVVGGALSVPGKVLSALKPGRGNAAGRQAADASAQTDEQVRAVQAQNEAALSSAQTARILQRACKWRAEGRDVTDLIDALPKPLQAYVKKLTIAECTRLSETDARAVVEWISGKRGPIPGVRTPDEMADGHDSKPKPTLRVVAPGATETANESQVLNTLAARLRARGRVYRATRLMAGWRHD